MIALVLKNYRQLDGLFGSDAENLRTEPPIEPSRSLVPDDFLEAVEAVGVHQLADVGACPLVLHARLDEVDGIDGGGAGRASDRAERESVHRLQHLDQHASLIGTLEQKRDFIRSCMYQVSKGPPKFAIIPQGCFGPRVSYRDGVELREPLRDLLHVLLRGNRLQIRVHNPPAKTQNSVS